MDTETIKRVQAPQPEPSTFGKCFITSRNPIVVPANAPKESFDKYGFYKYQQLKQFEAGIDLYPIQKNAKMCNALFFQTSNKIDVFITNNSINGVISEPAIMKLVEFAKTASKAAISTYTRENYCFLEKTSSNKLLFLEKGETKVYQFTYNGVNYQHISLPIFVLGGNYDYRHESDFLYFLRSGRELKNYILNNDNDNSHSLSNPNFLLPENIKNFILTNPDKLLVQKLAFPIYNKMLESSHRIAPKAIFSVKKGFSGYVLNEIFDSNTGAFKLDAINNSEAGIEYEVDYSYINPVNKQPHSEIYRLSGVLKVYGSGNVIVNTARVINSGSPKINPAWRGVVLPAYLADLIKKEIYDSIASLETKPAGCPPKIDEGSSNEV